MGAERGLVGGRAAGAAGGRLKDGGGGEDGRPVVGVRKLACRDRCELRRVRAVAAGVVRTLGVRRGRTAMLHGLAVRAAAAGVVARQHDAGISGERPPAGAQGDDRGEYQCKIAHILNR